MKTLMKGIVLAVVFLGLSHTAQAAGLPRSAKETFVTPYSVGGSTVTGSTFSASTTNFPGAVYQVVLSSGAASEYIVMFDSNSCGGLSATTLSFTAPTKQVGPRLLYGSTTANTSTAFDPPLVFFNGLCVFDSAVTGQASITYEEGRGISGQ